MKDQVLDEVHRKIARTNAITCPVNRNTMIIHTTDNVKCSDSKCMLYDHEGSNCSMKSHIYKAENKEFKYSFDSLLRL